MIVSFEDYLPSARFDGLPWTQIRIEEAPTDSGPWTVLETKVINPVDTDPTQPRQRSFTTALATLVSGWYRVAFIDAVANILLTDPIQNVSIAPPWMPSVQDVADLLVTRTNTSTGVPSGSFSGQTIPTGTQVQEIISKTVRDLWLEIGDGPQHNERLIDAAKYLASLDAAMMVELNFFPEQVASDRSPYEKYNNIRKAKAKLLSAAIEAAEVAAGETDGVTSSGMPSFKFPTTPGIGSARW